VKIQERDTEYQPECAMAEDAVPSYFTAHVASMRAEVIQTAPGQEVLGYFYFLFSSRQLPSHSAELGAPDLRMLKRRSCGRMQENPSPPCMAG
jgi:hypothetical protein